MDARRPGISAAALMLPGLCLSSRARSSTLAHPKLCVNRHMDISRETSHVTHHLILEALWQSRFHVPVHLHCVFILALDVVLINALVLNRR